MAGNAGVCPVDFFIPHFWWDVPPLFLKAQLVAVLFFNFFVLQCAFCNPACWVYLAGQLLPC